MLPMQASEFVPVVKQTVGEYQRHQAQWLAAALAYFTTFAIAPLIIVMVEIAGIFLGNHHQARHEIFGYLSSSAGSGAGNAVRGIVDSTLHQRRSGTLAQIIGWIIFILAAIGFFAALQQALNTVWDVQPQKTGFMQTVRQRALSFAVVMGLALLLLISLLLNAVLTGAAHALVHIFPLFPTLIKIADFVVSFGIITLVFALLFRFLPDVRIDWSDVWLGAAITSLLFVIGQFLLGWYLGRAGISSTYGAFGSLVIFLLWVNYTAQIVLLGAEFTHVYARQHGSHAGARA